MLMSINCSMVPSIEIDLAFDDGRKKNNLVSIGDLIDLLYNSNGLRKHIVGKVVQINTPGTDPAGWSMIVDGSDDFASEIARLSPMSVLDLDIIRKNGSERFVSTPVDDTGIAGIRINKGRLQYTRNGVRWHNIKIDDVDIIVKEEEILPAGDDDYPPCPPPGPKPPRPPKPPYPPRPPFPGEGNEDNDDDILD